MFAVVSPDKIQLPPGAVLRLAGDWQDYHQLVHQLGDRPLPRIKYRPGEILLMAPLPSSRYFPSFPVSELVLETLKLAFEHNTNAALRTLRQRVASLR